LRQCVTNLLSNAAKFTESGRIEVRVAIENGVLRLEVEDTGIGIAAADLSRIFMEFEQVDSSSTRRAGGTGLGLAITQRLCKMMNGEISVQSELGVGTCFTIRLPRLAEKRHNTDVDLSLVG
ncbi:MAG: ATP-binding protein, partial [Phycisphaerae bacterium]